MIRFQQLVIRSNEALIVGGQGRYVWDLAQETVRSKIYGPAFESIARRWALLYAPDEVRGGFANDVRPATVPCREHGKNHELDVVILRNVAMEGSRVLAIGEAKAATKPLGEEHLRRLGHVRELIGVGEAKLLLFGRAGFTTALRRAAESRPDVELIELPMLYG